MSARRGFSLMEVVVSVALLAGALAVVHARLGQSLFYQNALWQRQQAVETLVNDLARGDFRHREDLPIQPIPNVPMVVQTLGRDGVTVHWARAVPYHAKEFKEPKESKESTEAVPPAAKELPSRSGLY